MYPYVLDHFSTATIFLLLGIVVGVVFGIYRLHSAGLGWRRCLKLELSLAAAGLFGAKLYAIIARGHLLPLAEELTGRLRYPGGLLAAGIVLFALRRSLLRGVSLPALADAIAPATAVAVAIARLGCFAHGCCFGTRTSLPWALQFPAGSDAWHAHVAERLIVSAAPLSLAVHPLQLYFAAASALIAVYVTWHGRRARYAGQTALIFVALDGVSKGLLEILRAEPDASLQIAAFGAGLVASVVLAFMAWTRHANQPPLLSPPRGGGDALGRVLR